MRGNHDKVAFGLDQAEGFNAVREGSRAMDARGPDAGKPRLDRALPEGPLASTTLSKSAMARLTTRMRTSSMRRTPAWRSRPRRRPLCLFGHTHYPVIFELTSDSCTRSRGRAAEAGARLELIEGVKYLVNPGSVGQPRDGDPRAAYAIVDTAARQVELFRLTYPLEVAQAEVIDAGCLRFSRGVWQPDDSALASLKSQV